MATHVLVPGAWLGGWVWDRLRNRMPEFALVTPTLRGLTRGHGPAVTLDLDSHVKEVVDLIVGQDLRDVVLLGHSYAGLVVAGAVPQLLGRLSHVVYLDAALPTVGCALVSEWSEAGQAAVRDEAAASGDPTRWPVPPDLNQMSVMTDFSDEDLAWFQSHAQPHPIETLFQAVASVEHPTEAVRHTYIYCTRDRPDEPAVVSQLRDDRTWHVVELDTGHWPMITTPAALARLLRGF
ncbi:MAG: alpha/beta hydrolase [Pseudomonadota bacterium]